MQPYYHIIDLLKLNISDKSEACKKQSCYNPRGWGVLIFGLNGGGGVSLEPQKPLPIVKGPFGSKG